LDAIVMRALEKESAARYPTPAALSEDIIRYLTGHPVLARRATFVYRCRKYVRRHVKGLATAAAGGTPPRGWVSENILHGRQLAVERDRAQASLGFLVSLFQAADPDRSKGDAVTVREVLDQGVKRLPVELKDQPETRAALLLAIGEVYERMGRYDAA